MRRKHDARDRPHERQGRRPALDIFEAATYPGVLSSHSWMDLNWTERVYSLGGFVAQYMHGSEGFVAEAGRTERAARAYHVGYGFGTDFNGIGASAAAPRGATAADRSPTRSRASTAARLVDRQTTGQRTWDLNTDGAAHYGLVPDWIEDIRRVGGQDVVDDLFRGAESYLGTWGKRPPPGPPPRRGSALQGRQAGPTSVTCWGSAIPSQGASAASPAARWAAA